MREQSLVHNGSMRRDARLRGASGVIGALAVALLVAGGSIFTLQLPIVAAVALGVLGAIANLSAVRSARILAYLAAAFLGLMLASAGLYSNNPGFLGGVGAAALFSGIAAWREAASIRARWWHRTITTLVSAAALFVLYLAFTHIGGEGGFCWIADWPVGCLPTTK
jgi:hypothetical protein